jgi:hypothetical protein
VWLGACYHRPGNLYLIFLKFIILFYPEQRSSFAATSGSTFPLKSIGVVVSEKSLVLEQNRTAGLDCGKKKVAIL